MTTVAAEACDCLSGADADIVGNEQMPARPAQDFHEATAPPTHVRPHDRGLGPIADGGTGSRPANTPKRVHLLLVHSRGQEHDADVPGASPTTLHIGSRNLAAHHDEK